MKIQRRSFIGALCALFGMGGYDLVIVKNEKDVISASWAEPVACDVIGDLESINKQILMHREDAHWEWVDES